jgi:competence CoiA-like predicted nuclease
MLTNVQGESEEHMFCKKTLFEELPKTLKPELEKQLGEVRADVYFVYKGNKIAVEFQKSNLSIDYIEQKNNAYLEQGIYVLWVLVEELNDEGGITSLSKWKKYIKNLYFGKLYYWSYKERLFYQYTFGKHTRLVTTGEWQTGPSGSRYFSEGGSYERAYKSIFTFDKKQIDPEFKAVTAKPFHSIPYRKIIQL